MKSLIDLSQTVEEDTPVFPGDTPSHLFRTRYLDINGYNDYRLETGMHTGTHLDGPMHLTDSPKYISDLNLTCFTGEGCLLDVRGYDPIRTKPEFEAVVKTGSIVLLYTGMDKYYGKGEYFEKFPVVDLELCKFLIRKKIKMLGLDAPSPDRYPYPAHKMLLNSGIYLIENLTNLEKLRGKTAFEVLAFPLKIKADSSPSRVVAVIPG